MKKMIVLFLAASALLISCKKKQPQKCNDLKNAALAANQSTVKSELESIIAGMKDKTYTLANIITLNQLLSSKCEINAQLICFDCIKTQPTETEIRITIQSGNNVVDKTIDLSYDASNQIVFESMH
jgi:hypothetical protein